MPIRFECDSCGQPVTVADTLAGRRGKCRQCGYVMTVPVPGVPEDESGYALSEPLPEPEPIEVESTFSRRPANPDRTVPVRPAPAKTRKTRRQREAELKEIARRVAIGLGALVAVLGLVVLLAPHGLLIAGGVLAVIGIAIFGYGYLTTLYIAYTEDLMYAMLFFLFPPFALWYTVTRMEDLWHRLAIMAVGIAFLTVATWLLKASLPAKGVEGEASEARAEATERPWNGAFEGPGARGGWT